MQAVDDVGEALLGRQAARRRGRTRPSRRVERGRERALDRAEHLGLVAERRAEVVAAAASANADGTTIASAALDQAPLVQREPGGVGGGLGPRAAAAVEPHAGQRVAAVAARAVLAAA